MNGETRRCPIRASCLAWCRKFCEGNLLIGESIEDCHKASNELHEFLELTNQ